MLLSSRDKTLIALFPDRLIAVRTRKGSIVEKQVMPATGGVLSALSECLAGDAFKKTDATVILSSHFSHFAIMPWNEASLSRDEEMVLIQHRFSEIYGESATWDIRLNEGAIGAPALAGAVSKNLIKGITQLFDSSGTRLKSVQPYLMSAFNACRQNIRDESAWFVLAEKGIFCIALLCNGQWHRIRLLKSEKLEEAMLAIEREALLSDACAPKNIYLYAPQNPDWCKKSQTDSWSVIPLEAPVLQGMTETADMVCA